MEHQRKNQTDTKHLELLVIDEADRMLELGFCEDVEMIAGACNPKRQTLFYSATLHSPKVQEMAQVLLKEPVDIRLNDATPSARKYHTNGGGVRRDRTQKTRISLVAGPRACQKTPHIL